MSETHCQFREHTLEKGYRAVTLENSLLSITLLPEKGADVYSLVYKPRGMDVLWKSPWGLKPMGRGIPSIGTETEAAWLDHYEGGWQEIFPNGGDACVYKGAPLNFHGEASIIPWDYSVRRSDSQEVSVEFVARLFRSPFVLRRTVTVEKQLPAVRISETLTNEADEEMHFMWGHHPAYGQPFLSEDCRIQTAAKTFLAHDVEIAPTVRVAAGTRAPWPMVPGKDGKPVDLSVVPNPNGRTVVFGYLCDFDEGWYGITNLKHGFGIGLAWPKEIFPYAWFWQELRGSFGYPWYGRCSVMAMEPFTSIPGSGLQKAIERGTARTLAAGASLQAELAAVFFEGNRRLESVSTEGIVR